MLNKVTIQGRLCADPEMKTTQSGIFCANFRIGCTRNYKNPDGGYDSDFISVTAWKGTAELISKHFRKGDMIIVEGSLRSGSYTDCDGKKVYTTRIDAAAVYFAGNSRKSSDSSGYYPDEPGVPVAPGATDTPDSGQAFSYQSNSDDDYPF